MQIPMRYEQQNGVVCSSVNNFITKTKTKIIHGISSLFYGRNKSKSKKNVEEK